MDNTKVIKTVNNVIKELGKKENKTNMNKLFMICIMILKSFPPRKNSNKFIYGFLGQIGIIDCFNKIFISCIDLDDNDENVNGCEYKNDCKLKCFNNTKLKLSIKVKKSHKTSNIILINKNNCGSHDLTNLITIVLVIEEKKLYIIPHNIIPNKYLNNMPSKIEYKISILTYMKKDHNNLIYTLDESDKFNIFMKKHYHSLKEVNIYKKIYKDILLKFNNLDLT
jgi:hypothetical protein